MDDLRISLTKNENTTTQSIDMVLERGVNLSNIEYNKMDNLNRNTLTFKTENKKLKHKCILENGKTIGVLAIITTIIVIIAVIFICGTNEC